MKTYIFTVNSPKKEYSENLDAELRLPASDADFPIFL
jgi:hypothetical protein